TVYGIVKKSGGYIDVDSSPGKGTCFSICLPRVADESAAASGLAAPKPIPRGSETVLLIEDEEMVRKLASQMLKINGYHVLEARHGGEALLLCEQHKGRIHMMLTDVVMPQMSGRQLADRLRPLHPEMKVMYMSGYTDDVVLQAGLGAEFAFIQKPFLPDALARKVREVLDSTQVPPSQPAPLDPSGTK
ncbi:MAG: response regulator, partial [Blastocatellia bacterium]